MMVRRELLLGAGAVVGMAGAATIAGKATRAPAAAPDKDLAAEAAYPPLGRIIDVAGEKVHATDQGSGQPVVMIHGASGNLRDFTFDLTEPLATRFRVIAMDRPGFGYSTRASDENAWTPFAQASQLRAAAKQMGVEKPIVVGHSWGAAVALAWAIDAPDEVAGVVTASGAMMPWGGLADFAALIGVGDAGARWYARRLSERAETGGIADFITRAFRPQRPPPGYIEYIGGELAVRARTLAANTQDFANIQAAMRMLEPRYRDLNIPIEVIHGDEDWLLDFDRHALGAAKLLPQAKVTRLNGVGHMAHHASPETLNAAIARIAGST